MKFLPRHQEHNDVMELAAQIESVFEENNALAQKDDAKIIYSAEAYKTTDIGKQKEIGQGAAAAVDEMGLRSFLETKAHLNEITDETEKAVAKQNIEHAMQMATATAIALMNPESYQRAFAKAKVEPSEGITAINPTIAGHASAYTYSTEGFDNFKFENFRASAIISNALNAMTNSFQAVWFKPVIISPSEHGAEVRIRIPYVFNSKTRNADGSEYQPVHKKVIDAYIDRTILENTSNRVFANADLAGLAAGTLTPAADVPNRAVTLNSTTFNTRPIQLGKSVDMLAVSRHAGLSDGDKQSEQDTLAPTAQVGKLFLKVEDAGNSTVIEVDTTALNGSLFFPGQIGDTQKLILDLESVALADQDTPAVSGDTLGDIAELRTAAGNTNATDDIRIAVSIHLAGQFWPRRGNIKVDTVGDNAVQIHNVWNKDGDPATAAALTTLKGSSNFSITIVGYEPKLSRTNSNLRDKGLAVDSGSTTVYKLGVPMLSPISSALPISVDGGAAGMDDLQSVRRARENNIAVATLLEYEATIRACNGQRTEHAGIGSQMLTPTYIRQEQNLATKVVINESSNARDDVRSAIGLALEHLGSRLLEQSHYLATLDALYGTTAGFEFILVTSPRIHSLLMTSGDARLLGANRRFTIVANHDPDFVDTIYMSVRRPSEANVDPFSFAAHVSMPALVYHAPVTVRDGSHSLETQLIARDLFVGTCPLLARLDLKGMNTLFATDI